MGIITKVGRKFNLDKSKKYSLNFKKSHDIEGSLFSYAIRNKRADSLNVNKHKGGIDVILGFDHDANSKIIYHFKYNRDNLLLLRGASINKALIISDGSIPDFAISARPMGTNLSMEWVPAHERIKGVSLGNKLDIIYDDNSFKIVQRFNAVNPHAPNEILWEHFVEHKISIRNPYLEITNEMNFLRDTQIKRMYLTMLPANTKHVDKLYLSNGVLFNDIPNDGTELTEYGDFSSAMYTGEYNKALKYMAAVETSSIKDRQAIVTFRKDRVTKFYIKELDDEVVKENEVIKSTQRLVCITDN